MTKTFVALTVAAGAAGSIAALAFGDSTGDPLFLLALIALGAASERFKVSLFGHSHASLSVVVCMAAFLAGGSRDAVVTALVLGVAANLGGIVGLTKTLFNASAYVLSTLGFVLTIHVWAVVLPSGWPEIVGAATIGGLIDFIVNASIVGFVISCSEQTSFVAVVRKKFLWLVPHYLPAGAVAAALAIGYMMAGAWVVPAFAGALLGLQLTLQQYSLVRLRYQQELEDSQRRLASVQAELYRLQNLAA